MSTEGIGAILSINPEINTALEEADKHLASMSKSADELEKKFGNVQAALGSLSDTIKSTDFKVDLKFNSSGATKQLQEIVDAANKINAVSKSSAKSQVNTEKELNKKYEEILNKRADSYASLTQRIKELTAFKERMEALNQSNIDNGKAPVSDKSLSQISAAIELINAYEKRIRSLGEGFNYSRAMDAFNKAIEIQPKTVEEAKERLRLLKIAKDEFLKPGGDAPGVSNQINNFIDRINGAIDKTQAKLPVLQKEMEEFKTRTAANNVADNVTKAFELPQSTIEEVEEKIKSVTSAIKKLGKVRDSGNPFINEKDYQEAKDKLEVLRREKERLYNEEVSKSLSTSLDEAMRRNATGAVEMSQKAKDIESILRRISASGLEINGVDLASANLEKLKKKLASCEIAMAQTQKAAAFFQQTIRSIAPGLALTKVVRDLVNIRGEFEIAEKSIAVIVRDADLAKEIFNDIKGIAIKSPFQVSDLVKQTKQLAAYRIESDKLVETTKMLGDIAAGTGVEMNRLILAYGQVKAATVLKGTELRQFSEAGVNMLGGLAERFSEIQGRVVSTGEVLQMVSKKMVSFSDVDAVLRSQVSAGGTFYKMQEQQAETVKGMVANLRDRLDLMFNEIGASADGMIKGILKGLNWLMENYQLLLATVGSVVAYKLLLGSIVSIHGGVLSLIKSIGALVGVFTKVEGAAAGFAAVAPAVTAVAVAVGAIAAAVVYATKEGREYNKIVEKANENTESQIAKYTTLKNIVNSSLATDEQKKKALEELKTEYGNILPLQNETIETINLEAGAYVNATDKIREYNAEKQKQELHEAAVNNILKLTQRRIKLAGNAFMEAASNAYTSSGEGDGASLAYQFLKNIDTGAISTAWREVEDMILNGALESQEEALDEFYKIIGGYYNKSGEYVRELMNIYGEGTQVASLFSAVFKTFRKEERAAQKTELFKFYSPGNAKEVFDKISNLNEKYEEELRKLGEGAGKSRYEGIREVQAQLDGWQTEILKEIESTEVSDSEKEKLRNSLSSAFSEISLSPLEKEFNNVLAKAFENHPRASIGLKEVAQKESEELAPWIKRLEGQADILRATINQFSNNPFLFSMNMGGLTIEEAGEQLAALDEMTEGLKKYLVTVKSQSDIEREVREYRSNLKSLFSEINSSVKEFDKLSESAKKYQLQLLNLKGTKVGIKVTEDDINPSKVNEWLEKLRTKLGEEAYLELKLTYEKDQIADTINKVKDEVSVLWDKYDTSKKALEYGIVIEGYESPDIYNQILSKENELRKLNTKESIDASNDVKEKRLQILRNEQEEAMKVIAESNKKALDKTTQAYKDMFEDIRIMRTQSNADGIGKIDETVVNEAVAARITKGFDDITKAEWEAYKGTQMYVEAFGDLDGLSDDILSSFEEDLKEWVKKGAGVLAPTEIKAIQNTLDKIADKKQEAKAIKFFDIFTDGFKRIKEARELIDNKGALELKYADAKAARKDADEALESANKAKNITEAALSEARLQYQNAKSNYESTLSSGTSEQQSSALETLIEAEGRLAQATAEVSLAENDVINAHFRATDAASKESDALDELSENNKKAKKSLEDSIKVLSETRAAFDKLSSLVTGTIGLVEDTGEAFGLTFSDETTEAINSFSKGFTLLSSALALAQTATELLKTKNIELLGTVIALDTALPILGIIAAAIGGISAAITIHDNDIKKNIENHRKSVDLLKDEYDDLMDSMEHAISYASAKSTFDEMNRNIREQQENLEEMIRLEQSRGAKKDEEAIEEHTKQIQELGEESEKAKREMLDLMGVPENYRDVAHDWASNWLDAYKETGDGLDALSESFDELYDNLVLSKLQTMIMGPAIKRFQDMLDSFTEEDMYLSDDELRQLKELKEGVLRDANEQLRKEAEALGVNVGSTGGADNTLQKGIQSVTETTAEALQSLLNSMRYYVVDTNALVARISSVLTGDGESESPILKEMKVQTSLIRNIDTLLGSMSKAGHPLGGYGLKVFMA